MKRITNSNDRLRAIAILSALGLATLGDRYIEQRNHDKGHKVIQEETRCGRLLQTYQGDVKVLKGFNCTYVFSGRSGNEALYRVVEGSSEYIFVSAKTEYCEPELRAVDAVCAKPLETLAEAEAAEITKKHREDFESGVSGHDEELVGEFFHELNAFNNCTGK